ncbi:uncharacterized protein BT62DRAFT_1013265 [Guyanagaster necrorhizus]|uniref:Uncharacterized protein n=1 Tax=Guyanagaster necrorhizus TaxID=856835 RepID=A0A9P7VFU3_9AGAR|nr:uncharacterized protein BT62DRAFT_1013265 [Guyanagaster necrorhizus MCA 3950]KAG7439929.1 hypothetical protein BT62DRAFT_1013265 [Guyanagaster necrorhizus MCA 3950]
MSGGDRSRPKLHRRRPRRRSRTVATRDVVDSALLFSPNVQRNSLLFIAVLYGRLVLTVGHLALSAHAAQDARHD